MRGLATTVQRRRSQQLRAKPSSLRPGPSVRTERVRVLPVSRIARWLQTRAGARRAVQFASGVLLDIRLSGG
jgi:hypothetical protein